MQAREHASREQSPPSSFRVSRAMPSASFAQNLGTELRQSGPTAHTIHRPTTGR